jgi:hypothetical protein
MIETALVNGRITCIMPRGKKMSANTYCQAVNKGLLECYNRPESDKKRRNSDGWFH